jgi:hypothetical protein
MNEASVITEIKDAVQFGPLEQIEHCVFCRRPWLNVLRFLEIRAYEELMYIAV